MCESPTERPKNYSWNQLVEPMVSGIFVPWNIRSHDGTFVLGTIRFRSLNHSFPGPFVPWNFRSLELSFEVPWTFPVADRSCIAFYFSQVGLVLWL